MSFPALHASMSISSLLPETRTLGWLASIAMAGSFCLFCENGAGGLPLLTKTSVPAPSAVVAAINAQAAAIGIAESFVMNVPPQPTEADERLSQSNLVSCRDGSPCPFAKLQS